MCVPSKNIPAPVLLASPTAVPSVDRSTLRPEPDFVESSQVVRQCLDIRKNELLESRKVVWCLVALHPSTMLFLKLPLLSSLTPLDSSPHSISNPFLGLKSSSFTSKNHSEDETSGSNLAPSNANNSSASDHTASGHTSTPLIPSSTKPGPQDPDEEPPPEADPTLTRTFNPFDQLKTIREVNEAIKAELTKPHPADEGFIYGFLHPNTLVRMGTGPALANTQVIKIGRTVNIKRRMKQWKKQCRYKPCVVLALKMPQHHRIERVVHHQLHNVRLREFRCPGCGGQHNEWFRVNTVYAEHLVGMWMEWALRRPFDGLGNLLPEWEERLEYLDLEDPGCWMWFILGPSLDESAANLGPAEGLEGGSSELADPSSDQHSEM